MAADVYSAIAEYLKKINDTVITPVLVSAKKKAAPKNADGQRPDKLALFQRVLMRNYRNAVAVFEPAQRTCSSTSQCDQGEECIDGVCKPVPSVHFPGQSCRITSDCDQGEECIDFVCVPVPFELGFEDLSVNRSTIPDAGLEAALSAYANKIQAVIVNGLGKDKSKLVAVRAMLLQAYADACKAAGQNACKAAGQKSTPCKAWDDCPEDYVCVDGVCVPVPFRLVFRAIGG